MSGPTPDIEKYAPSDSGSSEASDILDLKDDEGWEDAEPEEEEQNQFVSLLDDEVFSDMLAMLQHCKEKHSFDFLEVRQTLGLDFYGSIKLTNYLRSKTQNGEKPSQSISKADLEDEKYLKPVLEDDAFLFSLDDLPDIVEQASGTGNGKEVESGPLVTLNETLDERWNKSTGPAATKKEEKRDDDSQYFTSYSYNDIHETMLKDTIRTDAYRDFIYNNKSLFEGKTVLDVGCGTGILSMFCAKAGAARGKVEEVKLPVDHVDIIVSEWMGYCLLYEAMLDSVIWARDKYLKPDGLMVPSHMNMWVAPVADPDYVADHIDFWRDVYGFDMKAMQAGIYDDAQVLDMPARTICGEPFPFLQLSLHTTTVKDLTFKRKWETKLNQDIDALDGFMIWFDSFFMPTRKDEVPENAKAEEWAKEGKKGVAFTTGPKAKVTHWKQGVLLIDNAKEQPKEHKKGEQISGELEYLVADDYSRALTIGVDWKFKGEENAVSQTWKMR
ncbi:hypothetical protein EYC84_009722 [Monilinia fructicola]|uniref:type I protein arginine methyltransferase n=1 Tax=Monilinia fructicola TaxID=38448 RepID=A0A5M9J9M2_MONFR|nr:hypothetical protein EYC84_009722 [Monilinia fructicola]